MRALWPPGVIVVVAVRTGYQTADGIRAQEAGYLEIHTGRFHGVKRWIRKVKLQTGVELINLARNAQCRYDVILRVAFITYGIEVLHPLCLLSGGIYSRHPVIGAGSSRDIRRRKPVCHVGVVAILTLHVRAHPTP